MDTVLNSKILLASSRGIELKVEEAVYFRGIKLDGMDLTPVSSRKGVIFMLNYHSFIFGTTRAKTLFLANISVIM